MTYFDDFRANYLADCKEGRAAAEKQVKALFLRCKRDKFQPPTLDEVRDYCREKGYGLDPLDFWEFYESKGWLVGRVSMANWKAAVNRWEREDKRKRPNRPVNSNTYQQKWEAKQAARREQAAREERERRETLAEIWKEAGEVKGAPE